MHPDVYKRPLFLGLLLLITGLLFFYHPVPGRNDVSRFVPQKDVTVIGRVERFYTAKPKSNNVVVKVFTVNGGQADGYVYARLAHVEPLWKDTLEITGRLQEPYGVDMLGNFNWRRYLAYKHVFAEIKSDEARVVKQATWPYRAMRAVRADILRVFDESFSPSLAHIAGGVLLGERGDLDPQLYTAFQDSGAIHLLVASGGNVGFVTLMTFAICGLFSLSRRKSLAAALVVAGIYTWIAGADAPLIRAYFMTLCGCLGYYLGRNSGVFQGLVLSCFAILVFYPASLFETGFQMSFIATAALIICLANYPLPAKWPKGLRFFAQIFLATLAVQLALLPIFTNVFYKVSVTGLVANMVLVPLASVLLGLSFAYYVFSLLHIGFLLYYPTAFCLQVFQTLVEFFASFRLSALPVAAWGVGTVIAYYAVLFWAFHLPLKKWARKAAVPVLVVVLGALIGQAVCHRGTRVYLLDEWYKNTAIVQTADGHTFVVGTALKPKLVLAALHKLGRRQADVVFSLDNKPVASGYNEVSPKIVRPFVDVWPDDNAESFGKTAVRIVWGIHETKNGRIWYNTGYSGTDKDDVSACFGEKKHSFCLGAGAQFVQTEKTLTRAAVNQTVEVRL